MNTYQSNLKIHIFYHFTDQPFGGGNQFLKALKDKLLELGLYVEDAYQADIILINASPPQIFTSVTHIQKFFKCKTIIVRIDGPIQDARNRDFLLDKLLIKIFKAFSDGLIFQSAFSKARYMELGLTCTDNSVVIWNAPNDSIFNNNNRKPKPENEKIKIITASWSSNWRKGFDIFQYLDNNLNFNKYEMTFVGNSPINFKKIRMAPPVKSEMLSLLFQQSDIFISASMFESCSNSLLEAIHCGCIPIVRNNSSQPEIISNIGVCFNNEIELLDQIDHISRHLPLYCKQPILPGIHTITQKYFYFMQTMHTKRIRSNRFDRNTIRLKLHAVQIKFLFLFYTYFLCRCKRFFLKNTIYD